jgi:glycosyltransferase involved in cell wall biosynthesis
MFTVIFPPAIGGPATQCFNLCKALSARGVVPVVVTYGDSFTRTEPYGYPLYTFRRFYGLGVLDRLMRWSIFPGYMAWVLRRERIDVLHCHSVNMLSFVAALVAKLMGIPRILKFAGDWVWETLSTHRLRAEDFREVYRMSILARFMTAVERISLRLFDVIWTPSVFRRENVEYLIGKAVPTVLIPNCLLLSERLGARPRGSCTIVSANRFIPHKRVPLIVEAYAGVRGRGTRLVLVGGGDAKQVDLVREKVHALGLEGEVTLTGILSSEEVYREFSEASIYVSASLEEGFPNVFIEAMHYGLPIVAADVGGCRELVREGETGFLVPPNDERTFAERIARLVGDRALRERMSKAAEERSREFNLNLRIGEFMRLYEGLLRSRRR